MIRKAVCISTLMYKSLILRNHISITVHNNQDTRIPRSYFLPPLLFFSFHLSFSHFLSFSFVSISFASSFLFFPFFFFLFSLVFASSGSFHPFPFLFFFLLL